MGVHRAEREKGEVKVGVEVVDVESLGEVAKESP